jgi:hypothetical protein
MVGVGIAVAQEPNRNTWRMAPCHRRTRFRAAHPGRWTRRRGALSLHCRKAQQRYALEIRSPALAARPEGEELRVSFKIDDGEQVWLTLATGPDGTVPIAHQTAFWIIYAALIARRRLLRRVHGSRPQLAVRPRRLARADRKPEPTLRLRTIAP